MARPDGLVIVLVLRVGGTFGGNIRRQRHRPGLGQRRVEIIAGQVEPQMALAVLGAFQRRRQRVGKPYDLANLQLFQRLDQSRPRAIGARFQQGHLDPRFGGTLRRHPRPQPGQPRRDHPRVVQHQPVARAQPFPQIGHLRIVYLRGIRHQQTRRGARHRRAGRDQPVGQVKVEVGQFHDPALNAHIRGYQGVAVALARG